MRKTLLWLLLFLIIISSASSLYEGWGYKKKVHVDVSNCTVENATLEVPLSFMNLNFLYFNNDCSDLRVSYVNVSNGQEQETSYKVSACNLDDKNVTLLVHYPLIPPSGADIYVYYDNPSATSNSNDSLTISNGSFSNQTVETCTGGGPPTILNDAELWYTFDNGDATDDSGNGNDGTLNGPVSTTNAISGKAMSFDGSNDYIDGGAATWTDGTTALTLCAWIYPLDTGNYKNVISKWNIGARQFHLRKTNSDTVQMGLSSDNSNELLTTGSTTLSTNAWHFVCGVFNGSANTGKVYVNGSLDGSSTSMPSSLPNSNEHLRVGVQDTGFYWNGDIDEVLVWTQALTDDDISDLFNYFIGNTSSNCTNESSNASNCSFSPFFSPEKVFNDWRTDNISLTITPHSNSGFFYNNEDYSYTVSGVSKHYKRDNDYNTSKIAFYFVNDSKKPSFISHLFLLGLFNPENLTDLVGNASFQNNSLSYSLSISDGVRLMTGKYGLAGLFNGVNGTVMVNDFMKNDKYQKDFTLTFWYRFYPNESTTGLKLMQWYPMFYIYSHNSYSAWEMYLRNDTHVVRFRLLPLEFTGDGAWHHIALIVHYNDSTPVYVDVYKDGLFVNRLTEDYNVAYNDFSDWFFKVGYNTIGSGNKYFNGSLDEIRLYPRLLDNFEVSEDMSSAKPISPTLLWLSFDSNGFYGANMTGEYHYMSFDNNLFGTAYFFDYDDPSYYRWLNVSGVNDKNIRGVGVWYKTNNKVMPNSGIIGGYGGTTFRWYKQGTNDWQINFVYNNTVYRYHYINPNDNGSWTFDVLQLEIADNGSKSLKWYRNGEVLYSSLHNYDTQPYSEPSDFRIGSYIKGFNGSIAAIYLFNNTLTDEDVKNLYNTGLGLLNHTYEEDYHAGDLVNYTVILNNGYVQKLFDYTLISRSIVNFWAHEIVTNKTVSYNITACKTNNLSECYTTTSNVFEQKAVIGLEPDEWKVVYSATGYYPIIKYFNVSGDEYNASEYAEFFAHNYTINITFKDEDTDAVLTGVNVSLDVIGDYYAENFTTNNGSLVINTVISDDYVFRYYADGYELRLWYMSLGDVEHLDKTFYLVKENKSSNVTVTVIDENSNYLSGAVVKALKYYLPDNTYKVQEVIMTNGEGKAYFKLNTNEFYKFIVEYNGVVVGSTNPAYITSNEMIIQVIINQEAGSAFTLFKNINYYFVNGSNTITLYYDDVSNTINGACLYIYRLSGTKTLLNSSCNTAPSGSVSVDYYENNGLLEVEAYYIDANNDFWLLDKFDIEVGTTLPISVGVSVLITVFVVLGTVLFSLIVGNTYLSLIISPLSIIIMKITGIVMLGWASLSALFIVGLILTFIIAKKD